EMHDVMDALGKSPEQVQADAGILRSANAIRAKIDEAKGSGKRRSDAEAAIPAFIDETNRIADERKAELARLERELADRARAHDEAVEYVKKFNGLKNDNAELLRPIKPALIADVD